MQRMSEVILNHSKKRREECKGKTFELVGLINVFNIIPDFVLPVFVCKEDGKEYLQEGDDDAQTLNSFYETEGYEGLQNVIKLEDINKNDFTTSLFTIDSDPVFAFQISEKDFFIGYAKEMKEFLKGFHAEGMVLKKQIEDFLRSGKND